MSAHMMLTPTLAMTCERLLSRGGLISESIAQATAAQVSEATMLVSNAKW